MTACLLDVRAIGYVYGTMTALADVSFQVHEGEIFGLLGPNGAGKTTLFSMISDPMGSNVRFTGAFIQRNLMYAAINVCRELQC